MTTTRHPSNDPETVRSSIIAGQRRSRSPKSAYPGAAALLAERGLDPKEMVWWPVLWETRWARERLGDRPRYDFGAFLDALRTNDETHYEVRGLPWWGV